MSGAGVGQGALLTGSNAAKDAIPDDGLACRLGNEGHVFQLYRER